MLDHPFLSESRNPVPLKLLQASILLCGIVPLIFALKSTVSLDVVAYVIAIVAGALTYLGWNMSPSRPGSGSNSSAWLFLLLGGTAVAFTGPLIANALSAWIAVSIILLPVLVILHARAPRSAKLGKHVLAPLMFGSIFLFMAGALGAPGLGAFPAAIGALFVAVIRSTLDIEEDIFENHADSSELEVEHHYRYRLAVAAVIFFLFGTVSLWPWLGEIYSRSYFWLMLLGVLIPLAYFWGRIRQPKIEGAKTALIRFNRIAPVLGLMHVLAMIAA